MNAYADAIDAGHCATLWVCDDCFYSHHGFEAGETNNDREPLNRISPDTDLSSGLRSEEHSEGCTPKIRETDGCECETTPFSWSACDGCGSNLGGTRHAMFAVFGVRPVTTDAPTEPTDNG